MLKKLKSIKGISGRFLFFDLKEESLIIVNQSKNKVAIYNINKGTITEVNIFPDGNEIIHSAAISPNCKNIAISSLSRKLVLIDLEKKTSNSNLPHIDSYMSQLKFLDEENK